MLNLVRAVGGSRKLKEVNMITKKRSFIMATLAAAVISAPAHAVTHYDMLMAGFYNGPSVSGTIGFKDIFEKVPVGLELGLGYSWTPTGDATLACQVFINQNQNNNTETINSGGVLDIGLNATYPLIQTYGPVKFSLFAGPRMARWAVRHEYVNGNEDFDVVSWVWGLGGGVRGSLPLGKSFTAIMQVGLDYY